ncbi:MAG: hypothetical protein HY747_10560 [Elusimicrobia bacterium]|nr:hypothetical protein [Elusimicrobiota bacterium]
MKVDISLQEVWDWKDGVYQETKHLSVKEAARKIHEDVEQIKKKYGLKLGSVETTSGMASKRQET